jgi:outer membrane protein assembly factor BamA
LPYVGYNPVTSIQIGAGASLSWYLGDPPKTKLSAATVSAQVTFNRQVIIQAKSNVFTRENRWFLQGDWRFYIFNLSTYGLGTESGYTIPPVPGYAVDPEAESETNGIYGMDFNWFKFHQVVSRKIRNHLYAGIGYHFDAHYNIKDTQLKLDTPDVVMTPHYAYCQLHGFNPEAYISSGLSLNFIYDTRDNIINPYRGFYVNINYKYNFTGLGSAAAGSKLWTEFRSYVGLSKRLPRHLIAFWFYGSFMVSGVVPYLDLPATGFDQMNSSGRGYDQGRWRGEDFVYGEVEYRFPISQCSQILGGVVFVNATTASNRDMDVPLFESVRPAVGAGLRIMVSKRNRINLLIDFAIGQKSNGFYVQAQEAF